MKMQPDTIKDGNPINSVAPAAPKSYSTFNLSRRVYTTQAYGDILPSVWDRLVKGDSYPFRHEMSLRTFGLKAPLMSDVFVKKDSFLVYLQSILPNNWEKIVVNPNQGDDVNYLMNSCVSGSDLYNIVNNILQNFADIRIEDEDSGLLVNPTYLDDICVSGLSVYENILKYLLIAELFFSDGSLLANFDTVLSTRFRYLKSYLTDDEEDKPVFGSFDEFEQSVLDILSVQPDSQTDHIHQLVVRFYDTYGGTPTVYTVVPDVPDGVFSSTSFISFRHFLDLARQNLNFDVVYITPNISASSLNSVALYYDSEAEAYDISYSILGSQFWPEYVNFGNVAAYQLCCAHFYSNDHVDYIYSADLYRQLIWFYITNLVTASARYFDYNGVNTQYDALSGQMLKLSFASYTIGLEPSFYQNNYLTALFGKRKSLRYVDYFTGARTQPLGVGDTGVAVNDGMVDAVDIIRKTNMTRYLYWVERNKRKVSSYLKELFPGGAPAPDFHDPQFLSHTGDNIKNIENQNTATAQMEDANSITSNLVCASNNFEFNVTPDRPGYFIQLVYFDVPRAYATATDRLNYIHDRFSDFNPFCQWNGSQPILSTERGFGAKDVPWAYQMNYAEFKQKFDRAHSGFVRYLPGFAFLADNSIGLPNSDHLSPSYIRSWSVELDPFFIQLTGYTPASYFHFIIKHVALVNAKRGMAYAPDLI